MSGVERDPHHVSQDSAAVRGVFAVCRHMRCREAALLKKS